MKYFLLFVVVAFCSCKQNNKSNQANKSYDELIKEGIEMWHIEKKYDLALKVFEDALQKDSTRVEANYWVGCAYARDSKTNLNDGLTAIHYLDRAIIIDKRYRESLEKRGWVKMQMNDMTGAQNDFDEAIRTNPSDTSSYMMRANIKAKFKDDNGACDDFRKAASLGSVLAKQLFLQYCK